MNGLSHILIVPAFTKCNDAFTKLSIMIGNFTDYLGWDLVMSYLSDNC